MHKGIKLSASLMCVDWLNAGQQIKELEGGDVDYLHLDIIDGNFAPDFTMGSSIINVFREHCNLPSDYHLMADQPRRLEGAFDISPRDIYTIHQESSRNLHRDLVAIRQKGTKVGVALSPATPLETLEYVIEDTDVVLLMTVNPGYKVQPLVPQTIRKVEKLRKLITDMQLDITISVDGNVNAETIPDMVSAGADMLVLGSSGLFRKEMSIAEALVNVKEAITKGIERKQSA